MEAPSNDDKKNEPNLTLRDKIEETIRSMFESYNENIVIRDIVHKIPDVGILADIISSYVGEKFREQRLVQCMAISLDELNQITSDKIDRDFLEREEFHDLFLKVLENSLKTRHRERIRLNFKILAGALNKDKLQDRHHAEDFVYFVADLTPTDIMVAREIYKQQRNRPAKFDNDSDDNSDLSFVIRSGWNELRDICKLDDVEFDIAIHKLAVAALIQEVGHGYMGPVAGRYVITLMFLRLMNFIQLRANDPLFNLEIRDPED